MTTPDPTSPRRRPSRARRLVAMATAALLGAGGLLVGGDRPVAAEEVGPKIKVALTSDIDTLNPFLAVLATSTGILRFQYEPLVAFGTNNEVVPGLASEWTASPDARSWTFTIPEDRVWSDGEPLTAEDVVWTFEQIRENEPLQAANGGLVENVESITAPDPQTVQIELTAPQASNPGAELPIVPQHVWEGEDPVEYANDTDTVGSGPFTIVSHTPGQSVELVANPSFWRGAPAVSGLTYVVYRNSDAAVQGLRTGEVDVVSGLTPAQFQSLEGQQGITTNSGAGRRYTAMAINPGAVDDEGQPLGDGHPALQDPVLRKAIFTAVDKNQLLETVLQGLGKPAQTEMPTVYPTFHGFAPGTEEVTFDPAAANQMLDDAGYERGPDGVRLDEDGEPLSFRLMGRNSDPTHQQMADFIQPWLADIGIDTEVMMVTPNQVNDDSTLGRYDLYFTGWGIGPDPDFQLSINTCDSRPAADGSGATSENNWCSPEFDALFDQQHAELDPERRAELVKEAFSVLYEASVNNPIWYADTLEAYRSDRFTGFTKQPEETGVITGQNGYWGLYTAQPVSAEEGAEGAAEDEGGIPAAGWVGIAVAVLAGAGGAIWFATRRRGTADERE
ncbi:ABC transporter substrate-binding protein [Auraticoccus monumenti]|uniref:Peptide/nickel transport system substrate-binding protein n=1 Tax=Auraticoccus monumenti TaxID=675864 RepID=A0A1G6W0W6_9ACTN|nr:ABC transporter substrate-binding protein [Auraticoccus monumenti]SDD59532.1 peptide/nickel transport system substrate-binding protein [Auraticoccus monumenti]